jgi:DNA-binding transcriptional MerR regulator
MLALVNADTETWTMRELAEAVVDALAHGYRGAQSGQVRAIPDERTIRYYTTLGLIDRPIAMRGRTALYGRRHLVQIVAIKRLQEAGKSLAEIQETLASASDADLARIAEIETRPPRRAPAREPAPARARFWGAVPDEALEAEVAPPEPEPAVAAVAPVSASAPAARALAAIELAPGVSLVLDAARPLGAGDLAALGRAATMLLEELRERQLLSPERHV